MSHAISFLFLSIFLVLLNAFFVAAEFAMVKVRSTRIESLQEEGDWLARWAYEIVKKQNDYLSATQLGITLASLGLGWVGEPAIADLIEPFLSLFDLSPYAIKGIAFAIAFTILTFLHLMLGELVPKQIAIQKAESVLLAVSIPMRLIYLIFSPFLFILNRLTNFSVKLIGFKVVTEDASHTEEELRLIVEDSYEEGALSPRKASLLENVFDFTHRTAKHIMIPRQDIISLSLSRSTNENLFIAKESGHTRFPLCESDLDHVVGLINIKDIIWELEDPNLINLFDLKRSVLFVPEGTTIDQLLREFQSKKIHMAIVVDEFGSTSGLLTLEDVIEEIVGEIQDEFDIEQPKVYRQSEDIWVVSGLTTIKEVEQALDVEIHDEDNVTIGGFVLGKLGRMAKEGDIVDIPFFQVEAVEVKNNRIVKLVFKKRNS